MADTLTRAFEAWRRDGVRGVVTRALAATCYSRLELFERRLDVPLPKLESSLPLEFGLLDEAEADEAAALVPEASAARVRASLRDGARCFIARHEGRLVSVSWAETGHVLVPYLRGRVRIAAGDVFVSGAFVAPELRGHRVAAASGLHRLRWLQAAGYRRVLCLILAGNAPALSAPTALGYVRTGHARAIGAGRARLVSVKGSRADGLGQLLDAVSSA